MRPLSWLIYPVPGNGALRLYQNICHTSYAAEGKRSTSICLFRY